MATLSQEKPPNPATYHNEQTSDKDAALETGLISDEERLYDYNAQPWYTKPVIQVLLVSFICFLCPGMFNALTGLGVAVAALGTEPKADLVDQGGGMQDAETVDNGNVALYSVFAVVGFFGGTVCNRLGTRLCLFVGSLGYGIYMSSLYATTQTTGESAQHYVVAAGAILGFCAAILWTAQGSIMLSYATEETKGRYIALFWVVFNTGAVIGSIIPVARNWNSTAGAVDSSTYIVFMVLCFSGSFLPFLLAPQSKVIMPNGKIVAPQRHPTWLSEVKGLVVALKMDPTVVFLFPLFLASNYFYTYQFNALNGSGFFNIRARSLNNFCYWTAQSLGSLGMGVLLDKAPLSRKLRIVIGWFILFASFMAIFGGNYATTRKYTRDSVAEPDFEAVGIYDDLYPGYIWLYIFNGMLDAAYQTWIYFTMGAQSNDPRKLAYFVGWYKGFQSAGSAISFRVDANKTSFMTELISTWALCAGSLVIGLPQVIYRVKEHTEEKVVDKEGDVAPVT